ncbi:hypothetical protein [Pigmentibacter ruber]|uniref:hypothetical protein n=1 Tax=Pigmentibacter ruber TaxID=2683196 RepID=UPI00131C4012|nr:hypothetical protein [Pigmentibacter ruber]
MLKFEYHREVKGDCIRKGLSPDQTRKILKSHFIISEEEEFSEKNDYYSELGLTTYFNQNDQLVAINISKRSNTFDFLGFDIFTNFINLKGFLFNKNIIYTFNDLGIELEKDKIGIYIQDFDSSIDDLNDSKYKEQKINSIYIDFASNDCSLSFEMNRIKPYTIKESL